MAADEDKHNNRHETEQLSSTTVDDSLDEYGVWVKSGPEEVSDEETADSEAIYDLQQDDAPGSEDIESTSVGDASEKEVWDDSGDVTSAMSDYPESMDLSDEEEALLADLEDTDSNIDVPDLSQETEPETEQSTPDEASELSVPDDLDFSDDLELPEDLELSDDEEPGEKLSEQEDFSLDLPQEDLSASEPTNDEVSDLESPEADSTQEESFSMDLPGEETSELVIPSESNETQGQGEPEGFSQTEGFDNEDDLDMFFENGESEEEETESDIQFEYAENEDAVPDLEFGDEEESAQPEYSEPVNHGAEEDATSITQGVGDFSSDEHTSASDSNSNVGQENPPVTEISLEEVGNEDFDDVGAVAGEMAEPLSEQPVSQEQGQSQSAASGEYSREAFQLIQNELASIKSELAGLKDELQDLRGRQGSTSPPSAVETSPSSGASSEEEEVPQEAVDVESSENPFEDTEEALQGGEGGFFEEDEDETIALTGDELDNILNTAEFTEEQGQPTNFEDSDLDLDLSSLEGSDTLGEDEGLDNLETLDKADGLSDSEQNASEGDSQFGLSDEEIEDNIVELDTDDENYAFDAPETQEMGFQDEATEQQATDEQPTTDESEPFGGSPEDVDALANMDIDTELADIDELDDSVDAEPSPVDLQETDDQNEEPEYDTEPESGLGFSEDSVEDSLEQRPTEAEAEAPTASENAPVAGEPEAGEVSEELSEELPEGLKEEIRSVLSYMDQLLESLPEEKIREFANSEHFEVYKRLFEELELEP